MLCQLSYRGLAAAIVAAPPAASGEGPDLVAKLRERLLQLDEALTVGGRELPIELPLAQSEKELARRFERDLLLVPERVELRQERGQLAVGRLLPKEVRTRTAVQLLVE